MRLCLLKLEASPLVEAWRREMRNPTDAVVICWWIELNFTAGNEISCTLSVRGPSIDYVVVGSRLSYLGRGILSGTVLSRLLK